MTIALQPSRNGHRTKAKKPAKKATTGNGKKRIEAEAVLRSVKPEDEAGWDLLGENGHNG